ncbi:HIF1 (YLL022C) [Zygosaccharomyces parabailii]|uniref:ZYBA0S05-07008g1_1 n=1 Tax=Zygosaccharomyces bailii (strain CLIB 213 / ATCC 58445 / CBS 680 / BCRC 21525 / NBRC 1098 / NCYC 1416 / NRRL Y-2227) TaxID=1333698 RepID=A0A8J2X8I3_ZYGB2|nr:HIF1 (YLL022C) [Zygosaccharomyces parabailii]CDF90018.1 ZYBA0S05-07008g1_1 [Zygosaccharomyces bailii CLIB 213]CDH17776.1 uncharacterized protein ZBAI_09564 [Zygosaccharomyces bailii ISA1307]
MSINAHKDITTQEVQALLIEGAKYSASDDVEKAAKCYARVLDIGAPTPDVFILLARCLYRLGLKKNDVFGGGDENAEGEDEEMDEDDAESDEGSKEAVKQERNAKLYQFDHEEEEVDENNAQTFEDTTNASNFEDTTNASNYEDARGESMLQGLQKQAQEMEAEEDEGNQTDMSIGESFEGFLEGNLFENGLELLYRARIMYMEPQNEAKAGEELGNDTQLKLAQLYDLLGDIDQELEDFTQAVRDYEEALKFYDKGLAPEEREVLIKTYLKLADALRWSNVSDEDSLSKEKRLEHLQNLQELIRTRLDEGKSKDAELDKQHLERLQEDEELLKSGKPVTKNVLTPELMAKAILTEALGGSQKKINDLSKVIKKKKNKLLKRGDRS